ncbi:hypothetical protein RHOSPDRAFT_32593 [Rhodotorula sp. JG-1b]|nr:hypothetical protein RHOSPDRAFT_32593 [Rhodotorula sp. JG-1b]
MAVQAKDAQEPAFDSVLASGLYPAAVRLAHLAVQTTPHRADAAAPVATPEQLSEQAASLRNNLARLTDQANKLPAGQLSLEDQDWLIQQLETRVEQSRQALATMARLTRLDPVTDDTRAPAAPAAVTTEGGDAGAALDDDRMDTAA